MLTIVTCYHRLCKRLLFSSLKIFHLAFTYIVLYSYSTILAAEQTRHSRFRGWTYERGALEGCIVPKKERKREKRRGGAAAYISQESEFIDSLDIPISGRDMSTAMGAVDRHRDVQEFMTRRLSIESRELPETVDLLLRMHK